MITQDIVAETIKRCIEQLVQLGVEKYMQKWENFKIPDLTIPAQSENLPIGVKDAAKLLNCSTSLIYKRIMRNEIPFHKKPGTKAVLFYRNELLAWLKADAEPVTSKIVRKNDAALIACNRRKPK